MRTAGRGPVAPLWLRVIVIAIEEWLPAALIAAMALVITADVVLRYALNHPLAWAGPVAMFCMVWMVYLGSAAVSRFGSHICLDFFSERIGPRGRAALDLAVELITLGILGTVCVATVQYLNNARFLMIPGIGISKRWITVAAVTGLALMIVHAAVHAARAGIGFTAPDYRRVNRPVEEIELDDFNTNLVNVVDDELSGNQG